ncbi:hypothetical protein CC1G_03791 [Coprinopsis cinerea okayama7|uniref:Uncharacterized protein n=1 Tax=Coprinopsis cinerea (strain Okayama-7 / 130 / ATCC MYA-4618 / FGSC 9003) TaxID=240176 RepID=A8NGQ8_COPC7|nr:hypothetical protein CC1G_03791 [Coprinopsis cinerea okayama7\|eukprot:XP_001833574.1 hypothetical protein CC1G_03791 [Coprinopsis cinerea okayama7\
MQTTLDDEEEEFQLPNLRKPKPHYSSRHGPYNTAISFGPESIPDDAPPSQLNAAVNAHRTALHIMQWKARPIPSLKDMQEELSAPESLESIKEQMAQLQKSHVEELEKLYDAHAADYIQEMIDLYRSLDETMLFDGYQPSGGGGGSSREEIAQHRESSRRLEELYNQVQACSPLLLPLANEYSTFRHSYFVRMHELRTRYARIKQQQDAQFPLTAEEWRTRPKELRMLVARFLMAPSKILQEKMMTEHGWAWRLVDPLIREYKADQSFASEVMSMLLAENMGQGAPVVAVRSQTTIDPRLRRP